MSLEQNKAIARRHFEDVWNKGDMSAADEIYAPNYMHHPADATDMTPKSRDEFKKFVTDSRSQRSADDFCFVIEDMIAEGDKVTIRWNLGLAGKPPMYSGIDIQRIVGGQIVEDWNAMTDLRPKS